MSLQSLIQSLICVLSNHKQSHSRCSQREAFLSAPDQVKAPKFECSGQKCQSNFWIHIPCNLLFTSRMHTTTLSRATTMLGVLRHNQISFSWTNMWNSENRKMVLLPTLYFIKVFSNSLMLENKNLQSLFHLSL